MEPGSWSDKMEKKFLRTQSDWVGMATAQKNYWAAEVKGKGQQLS